MKKVYLSILIIILCELNFAQNQNTVLFVSPDGDDNNSGLTEEYPLKTINFALTKLNGNWGVTDTIYLLPGTYSKTTNGEIFELELKSNLCLKGSGVNETILMGDYSAGILFLQNLSNVAIMDLSIKKGDYGLGGGIYCQSSNPRIENVIISECRALQGGGINCSFGAVPTLINVLLYNNIADDWGGALYGYHAGYNLVNVTIANNKSNDLGGGIYCQSTFINGVNCIIWNNTPQQVFFYDLDSPNSIELSYSNIQDGRNGIWDNANGSILLAEGTIITRDPLFTDAKSGNYHLGDSSYCIGTGVNNEVTPLEDIEHNPRQINNSKADLGAYENSLDVPLPGLIIADFTSRIRTGYPPLEVGFINLSRSSGEIISWGWDFNNDGETDSYEKEPLWIFNEPGFFTVSLKASDGIVTDSLIIKDFVTVYRKEIIWISPEGSDTSNGTLENPFFTIQRGIEAAATHDTILLEPGVYNENIDYKGKNIIIGSRFLLTQDTSFISSTRIKGKPGDNVVKFLNNENNRAVLAGLTIEGGKNVQEGGGIYCRDSQPFLKNLKIINNSSIGFGGGLACRYGANPILNDVFISNNTSSMGGGISCIGSSNPRIERTLIVKNSATWEGDAFNILEGSDPVVINCTVAENQGSPSGAYIEHSSPLFLSSILWNNGTSEIKLFEAEVSVAYSDIKGGQEGIKHEYGYTIHWLQNNINIDPEFENTAERNFNLKQNSPCIDAGTAFFLWQDNVLLNLYHQYYSGSNPDIGVFEYDNITYADDEKNLPVEYDLLQNYPNPFNPNTSIQYTISSRQLVSLKVYDVLGREVANLVNEEKPAGEYEVRFDGSNLSSGIYFYTISAGNFTQTKKLILLK